MLPEVGVEPSWVGHGQPARVASAPVPRSGPDSLGGSEWRNLAAGASTFLLEHEIDTGHVLGSVEVAIGPDDTTGDVHDRLLDAGKHLLVRTIDELAAGSARPVPQDSLLADGMVRKEAPKLFQGKLARIDWAKSADGDPQPDSWTEPFPGAWTALPDGASLRVRTSRRTDLDFGGQPGTVHAGQRAPARPMRRGRPRIDPHSTTGQAGRMQRSRTSSTDSAREFVTLWVDPFPILHDFFTVSHDTPAAFCGLSGRHLRLPSLAQDYLPALGPALSADRSGLREVDAGARRFGLHSEDPDDALLGHRMAQAPSSTRALRAPTQ